MNEFIWAQGKIRVTVTAYRTLTTLSPSVYPYSWMPAFFYKGQMRFIIYPRTFTLSLTNVRPLFVTFYCVSTVVGTVNKLLSGRGSSEFLADFIADGFVLNMIYRAGFIYNKPVFFIIVFPLGSMFNLKIYLQ